MHFSAFQTGGFTADEDLTTEFETDGSITLTYNDGTNDRTFMLDMAGADTSDPYIIEISGAKATEYTAWRAGLPTSGTIAATLVLDDGQRGYDGSRAVIGRCQRRDADAHLRRTARRRQRAGGGATSTSQVGGSRRTVSTVAISGSAVTLTLSSATVGTDTVTASYTPGTNPIQDEAGNDASALSGQAVINRLSPTPVIQSLATSKDGATVILTYDRALDPAHVPATGAFAVEVNDTARAVTAVAVSGTTVTLTLASAVGLGDTITLAYTPPGAATRLQDVAGNAVAAIATGTAVENEFTLLPYTIDVPHDSRLGTLLNNWLLEYDPDDADRAPGVPAEAVESTTPQEVRVQVSSANEISIRIGTLGNIDFVPQLEDAALALQNTSGTTFHSVVLSDTDSSAPYLVSIPAAAATALQAYTGTLRMVFDDSGIEIAGTGEGTFRAAAAATLSRARPAGVGFAGSGEATFQFPLAATLSRTAPTPVALTGAGAGVFRAAAAAALGRIAAQKAVGTGTGTFRAAATATLSVIIRPERFTGAGAAAFRAPAAATLGRTEPTAVRFAQPRNRNRRATFQPPTAAVLTRNVPRRFAGTGTGTFRATAATLSRTRPTGIRFADAGSATFQFPPSATLSRTLPTAVKFSGVGSAAFRTAVAAILERNLAQHFSGSGAATFRTAEDATLESPTPLTPGQGAARAAAHTRDLTRTSDLFALKVTHPDISAPIRVVADNQDITIDGDNFTALAFRAVPPNFQEGETPRAVLEIDNVGRELTQWIELTGGGRGATMEVMQIHRDPVVSSSGHVTWSLPALPVGVTEVTNEVVQVALAYRTGRSRPGVKWRHDYETSPGIFAR